MHVAEGRFRPEPAHTHSHTTGDRLPTHIYHFHTTHTTLTHSLRVSDIRMSSGKHDTPPAWHLKHKRATGNTLLVTQTVKMFVVNVPS
jgi:hypothetical protein